MTKPIRDRHKPMEDLLRLRLPRDLLEKIIKHAEDKNLTVSAWVRMHLSETVKNAP